MLSRHKSFTITIILAVLVLASVSLSACEPAATAQPTRLPNPTATVIPFTETPDFSSGATEDAMLQSDRLEALEATKTLISSLPNASQEEIAEVLLLKWLEYYKTDKVDAYFRLKDYKIEQVTFRGAYCPPPDKDTRKFSAEVQFSVQTVTLHPGDWEANASAVDGDDHWIYHIRSYVGVSAKNGIYTLSFAYGTGC